MRKKGISLLLAFVMLLSLLPTAVWAENASVEAEAKAFMEDDHPFTWNGTDYLWRFEWSEPDASRGEWHLFVAENPADSSAEVKWENCGAEKAPFTHLTKETAAYEAAAAMRTAWEEFPDDPAGWIYDNDRDLFRLISMMSLETFGYTDEDLTAAKAFYEQRIGIDGSTAELVPLNGLTKEAMLEEYYNLKAGVRSALQATMHGVLESADMEFNFTQMLFRTERSMSQSGGEQGGGEQGDPSFEDYTQTMRDAGFTAPRKVELRFPDGLVEGTDYSYTYDNTTGDLHIKLLRGENAHWLDAAQRLSSDRSSLEIQIGVYGTSDEVYAHCRNGNGIGGFDSLRSLTQATNRDHGSYTDENGQQVSVAWGGAMLASVNRTAGIIAIAPTTAMNHNRFAVVWGNKDNAITHRELVNVYIEMEGGPYTVVEGYNEPKPLPAANLKDGFMQETTADAAVWQASYEDGKLVLANPNGIPTSGSDYQLGTLDWDAMFPGCTVEYWKRTDGGSESGTAGEPAYVWTWSNPSGEGFEFIYEVSVRNNSNNDVLRYTLTVLQCQSTPYYARVEYTKADGTTATAVAPAQLDIDEAALAGAGILFTYDPELGYFHTSYEENSGLDYDKLVNTRVTLEAPEGAVTFSGVHHDGNPDPRRFNDASAEDVLAMLRSEKRFGVNDTDEEALNARSVPIMQAQHLDLPGINVCLSFTHNYRNVSVAWWDADNNLIGVSYVYGQNEDFIFSSRMGSFTSLDELTDVDERGQVYVPNVVGAENMELICNRYPQSGNGSTQFFELFLLNDQGGTKTVCIPYHWFNMSYADVEGKDPNDLPPISIQHLNGSYECIEQLEGRYEKQGIVFETTGFSPFLMTVGDGGGDQGGYGDNIGHYDVRDNGKAWNGDDLRYMVIDQLKNMYSDWETIQLGVDWRYREVGSIYNVGITPEVLNQLANANKPVEICNGDTVRLSAATVADMAQKLNILNGEKQEGEDTPLLWLRYEYGNMDGPSPNGLAHAFMVTVWLGDTRYTLPEGETYTYFTSFNNWRSESYAVYCPQDLNDATSPLKLLTDSPDAWADGDDDHSWFTVRFTAGHDGMFVIHPVDYEPMMSWPWWGVPTPPWQPSSDAVTPTNSEYLQSLYTDMGFKFPVVGMGAGSAEGKDIDVHFVFPEQLREWTEGCGDDWDYRLIQDADKGLITVLANMGSRDRWENAVRANSSNGVLDDGVYFRFYFGNSDEQRPMSYGYDWYGDYQVDDPENDPLTSYSLYSDYHHNNALSMASVNRQGAHSSTLTMNSEGDDMNVILAMSQQEDATVGDAEAKYAFRLEIRPVTDDSFSLPAENGVAASRDRIYVDNFYGSWSGGAVDDGSVFLYAGQGVNWYEAATAQFDVIANLTVNAPEGYTLRRWTNTNTGGAGTAFPAALCRDMSQTVMVTWQKENAPDLVEYVRVECMNNSAWFYELPNAKAPTHDELLPADTLKELNDNGITVTYDEKLGYFTTSVDASKLTDPTLLNKAIKPTAPEGAVYLRWLNPGGSENPATHDPANDISRIEELFSSSGNQDPISIAERGIPSVALLSTREMALDDDMTVYYADNQLYRSLIVQWLDAEQNVLGYSCFYGRNSDLNTTVNTFTTSEAPVDEVTAPTLVGENVELYCDRTLQTSTDKSRLFLLFSVSDMGRLGENGAEIYLPYSYFGMTAEQGMALANKGIRPLFRHYLDESCTVKESILGQYTEAGVLIVTHSFSPFLIDANQHAVGDLNGDGIVNAVDMQAMFENLSEGKTTGAFSDGDDFRTMADCNGDGVTNILDYQYLYTHAILGKQ